MLSLDDAIVQLLIPDASQLVCRLGDITVRYGKRTALDGVSLTFGPGVTALVGANGAGKSTLMGVAAGLVRPDSGTVSTPGMPGGGVVLMPQSFSPPPGLRVREFFELMGWLRAVPRPALREKVDAAISSVGLSDRAGSRLRDLSGGMQRRALLGQTLVSDAGLLLLDEPTAGLDPEQRVQMRGLIGMVGSQAAIVVSSHLMEDVASIADRVVILDVGKIIYDGSTEDLRKRGEELLQPESDVSPLEAAFLALRSATS